MSKKHIISLGGELASGKGSVSKVLMERLKFGVYKNGDYFRKLARESGMDVTSFNIYVKEHPEIDRKIENSAAEYAKTHDNFIDLIKRYSLENERYWNLYGVRKEDESNYDLVIDTTNQTPEDTADVIEREYKKWLEA